MCYYLFVSLFGKRWALICLLIGREGVKVEYKVVLLVKI